MRSNGLCLCDLRSIYPIEMKIIQKNSMGGIRKKSERPKKDDGKSKKPPPQPIEDDEIEDGDIATPKRDRYGDDDQPL